MKLSDLRALLKRAGIKTTESIDRLDVKYHAGQPVGVDLMLTDGTVAYLPVETG